MFVFIIVFDVWMIFKIEEIFDNVYLWILVFI